MSVACEKHALSHDSSLSANNGTQSDVYSDHPRVLADIFQENTNIVIWRRELGERLSEAVAGFIIANPRLETTEIVAPESVRADIGELTGGSVPDNLAEDIAELVEMFCCLLGLNRAGLRLKRLSQAMCPRFHVDLVPCRLVTTYFGVATEWLPHQSVDRSKLGSGNSGQSDLDSGLYKRDSDVRRLDCGDVALLKGEAWPGNEGGGLVHRSPAVPSGINRLLLTLDVTD